jgi:hypothetical protein
VKLDPILSQYLYNNKELRLQGIGKFYLDQGFYLPEDDPKRKETVRLEGIQFAFKASEQQDEGLIDFIVKETGKIKPLASADLDSYLSVARQFINIGKPFYIEGIGTISKNKEGSYEFVAGNFVAPRLEEHALKPNKQLAERETANASYQAASNATRSIPNKNSDGLKKAAPILIGASLLALLAVGGWWAYNSFFSGKKPAETENNGGVTVSTVDTTISKPQVDTSLLAKDSLLKDTSTAKKATDSMIVAPPVVTPAGMINYKVVIKTYYTSAACIGSYNKLKSYNLDVYFDTAQPANKKIYLKVQSPAADTVRVKDSLRRYYNPDQKQGKVYIEF